MIAGLIVYKFGGNLFWLFVISAILSVLNLSFIPFLSEKIPQEKVAEQNFEEQKLLAEEISEEKITKSELTFFQKVKKIPWTSSTSLLALIVFIVAGAMGIVAQYLYLFSHRIWIPHFLNFF